MHDKEKIVAPSRLVSTTGHKVRNKNAPSSMQVLYCSLQQRGYAWLTDQIVQVLYRSRRACLACCRPMQSRLAH